MIASSRTFVVTITALALLASCSKKGGSGSAADAAAAKAPDAAAPAKAPDAAAAPAAADAAAAPATPDAAAAADPPKDPKGDQAADKGKPKDLQVLPRSFSRAQVKKVMKGFNKALGVECDACHKEHDFAAPTKKKKAARAMMRMTGELNKKFFAGKPEVGCNTCHRGKEHPGGREH